MNTDFNNFADANGLKADPVSSSLLADIHYDGKDYYMKDDNGVYRPYPGGHASDYLVMQGLSRKAGEDGLSPVSQALMHVRSANRIVSAINLAGYPQGILKMGRDRLLVTHPSDFVQPAPGEWKLISNLLDGLLGEEQKPWLISWLHVFLSDLYYAIEHKLTAPLRPGQALILIGPANCGKTLFASILAAIFDARIARPYSFMTGETQFNNDLAESPILALDDEGLSHRAAAKESLAAKIKQFTVVNETRIHAKYQHPIVVPLRNRMLILLNDQPKSLMVLPDFDESMRDKVMLFKASKAEIPAHSLEDRHKFMEMIRGELPAFLHHVINEVKIPDERASSRFGVREYHHPQVLELLYERDAGLQLLELIDSAFAGCGLSATHGGAWQGTARQLERSLADFHREKEISRLLPTPNSMGMYLATLERDFPSRVTSGKVVRGLKRWVVRRAAAEDEEPAPEPPAAAPGV